MDSTQRPPAAQPLGCGRRPAGNGLFKRRGEPEGRALAGSAVDADCAAHHLDQLFGDGEPEPGAAIAAGGGSVGLEERGEERRDLFRSDADAGIGDGEANRGAAVAEALEAGVEGDVAAVGELDGVGGKVGEYLAQAVGIAAQERGILGEMRASMHSPLALA